MLRYNVFIHYDVENNTWKKEILAAKKQIEKLHVIREKLLQWWKSAVAFQIKTYNQKHKSKTFNKNDLVLLSMKNLQQKQSHKKLSHKYAESFHIADIIKKQAYCLHLLTIYQVHDVFHVFYLESYNWHNGNNVAPELSFPELIDESEKYEIEEILNK